MIEVSEKTIIVLTLVVGLVFGACIVSYNFCRMEETKAAMQMGYDQIKDGPHILWKQNGH